jgi:hypothetical protein
VKTGAGKEFLLLHFTWKLGVYRTLCWCVHVKNCWKKMAAGKPTQGLMNQT